MTDERSIPPLRELPPGRLAARRRHLFAEIAADEHFGRRARSPRRLRLAGAAAVAVAATAAVGVGTQVASDSRPTGRGPAPAAGCLRVPQVFYGCSSFLRPPSWLAGTTGAPGHDQ
jgi:hypothetical protein